MPPRDNKEASEEQAALTEALLPPEEPKPEEADEPEHDTEQQQLEDVEQLPTTRLRAVAWASTTPLLAKLLIPLLIVGTHCLFYYGQSANMWKLAGQYDMKIHYHAHSNEASIAFKALNIKTTDEIVVPETQKDLRVFTYMYAIQELWKAKGMPGVVLPRIAALGLILFSGVWPHLKLLLLLLTWWFARQPRRRRRVLNALSILGKWSLVDVLVVCVMVGVLHLEWNFEATKALSQLLEHWDIVVPLIRSQYGSAEDICQRALHYGCHKPKVQHIVQCNACITAVHEFYKHPGPILKGVDVSGGGHGKLEVMGLKGIYGFCGAVIASILLSAVVDWYDLKNRKALENSNTASLEQATTTNISVVDGGESTEAGEETAQAGEDQLLLTESGNVDRRTEADRAFDRRIFVEGQQVWNACWQVLAWITFGLVVYASLCITMERRVHGAYPRLLQDLLGVEWSKRYSFWLLGWTMEGGWDYMLMGTFCWFIIVGPIVRSILCVRASRQTERPDMPASMIRKVHAMQEKLRTGIDFVGAFCAWEVFTVAILMVDLLMPSITNTITSDCKSLSQGSESCFEVEFDMKSTFWVVIGSGILLWLVSLRIRNYRGYD